MLAQPSDATTRAIGLLVVDDHEVVRQGLVALFSRRVGFRVVGEAATAADAVAQARRRRPDLVLLDVGLPDGSGIEACRAIRAASSGTRVVLLTGSPDRAMVTDAIVAGADAFLLKGMRARELVAAVEAVARGECLLDPSVTGRVLDRIRVAAAGPFGPFAELNPRERQILPLLAEGRTNGQIALVVGLTENTTRSYVSGLLAKLHLRRRTEVAALVARHRVAGEAQ